MDPRRITPQAPTAKPAQTQATAEKADAPELPPIPKAVEITGDMVRNHFRAIEPHSHAERLKQLCRENPWLVGELKNPPKL